VHSAPDGSLTLAWRVQTIGAYFGMKQCKLNEGKENEKTFSLAIWDTAGEGNFRDWLA
jgi:hypothetical protein